MISQKCPQLKFRNYFCNQGAPQIFFSLLLLPKPVGKKLKKSDLIHLLKLVFKACCRTLSF